MEFIYFLRTSTLQKNLEGKKLWQNWYTSLNWRLPWLVVYILKQQFRSSSIDSEKKQLSSENKNGITIKKKREDNKSFAVQKILAYSSPSPIHYSATITNNIRNVHESSWIFKSVILNPGCASGPPWNSTITTKQSNKTSCPWSICTESTEVMSKHVWGDYDTARVRTTGKNYVPFILLFVEGHLMMYFRKISIHVIGIIYLVSVIWKECLWEVFYFFSHSSG